MAQELAKVCEVAAVKVGPEGSYVASVTNVKSRSRIGCECRRHHCRRRPLGSWFLYGATSNAHSLNAHG